MLTSFESAIAYHARRDLPNEACGLVLRALEGVALVAHETKNMSQDPSRFFQIPPEEVLAAKREKRLVGYYHSHPEGDHTPSPADMANAEECGLPSFVYGVRSGVLGCYVPRGWRAPLEGRAFVPMVHDCISLVWDWFSMERQIELPFFPRTQADHLHGTDFDFRALMREVGATLVMQPQPGDVLVMTTGASRRPNHMGVFLGDGLFIHQTTTGSRIEPFVGQWQKRLAFVARVPAAYKTYDVVYEGEPSTIPRQGTWVERKPPGEALAHAEGPK